MNHVSELCHIVLVPWVKGLGADVLGKAVPVRVGIAVSEAVRYIAAHDHLFAEAACCLRIEY